MSIAGLTLPTQLLFSFGLGTAAAPALSPYVQSLVNDAWATHPSRRFNVNEYGMLIAQGYGGNINVAASAAQAGYDANHLSAAAFLASQVPGVSQALFLWRLGHATQADFEAALKKQGMRDEWIARMVQEFSVPLTAEQIAVMIQRSVIPNQGQLPGYTPPGGGQVPRYPEVEIDGYQSAQAYGVSKPQLDALARIIGLPASPDLAARMTYRGIIDRSDFDLALAQGNTRVEWTPFLFDAFRQIPTAEQYVEAHLRGWISTAEMYAGTHRHGMTQADTDLEFQIHRRPMTPTAITRAKAWGGRFNPQQGEITDPYSASAHQGNLGPEWYDLYESLKYTTPSYFVLRALLQAGTLTEAEGETYFLRLGWPPDLAAKAAAAYAGGGGSSTDTHVGKAQTQLWTTTHRSYISGEITDTEAETSMQLAGVSAAAAPQVLSIWQHERSLIRKQLTPAQIKKAAGEGVPNPSTGAPWNLTDAIAALIERGYSTNDARTFMEL